jgi:hypothetical protein
MKKLIGASIAAMTLVSAASAATVSDTSLANINGPVGVNGAVATTTTDATGTRTTVTGPGGDANRAYAPIVTNTWEQSAVGGGATVGITTNYAHDGNGSVYFNTTGSNAKADLEYYLTTAVPLSSVTSLSFDYYRDSASTVTASLAPVMRLDILKNGSFAGSLVLENIYQAQQNIAPTDVWTTLAASLTNGIFWATNASLGPTFAAALGGQKTLQEWIDGNSGAQLTVAGVSIGVGSGWDGNFVGAVDDVNVVFTRAATINSNFEVAAAVPEPATWAMFIGGFGLVGAAMRRRRTTVRFA